MTGGDLMEDLKQQYNKALRSAMKQREIADEGDKETWSEIISDMNYVLDWLRSGRRPGNRRGAERKGYEQRTFTWDPEEVDQYRVSKMQQFQRLPEDEGVVVEDHDNIIKDALCELTVREKEVFEMTVIGQYTTNEIAQLLSVSPSRVKDCRERANRKIEHWRKEVGFNECSRAYS